LGPEKAIGSKVDSPVAGNSGEMPSDHACPITSVPGDTKLRAGSTRTFNLGSKRKQGLLTDTPTLSPSRIEG